MIEAKPTVYQGIEFRSLLEARWAAFFDALLIKWVYEPRKIQLVDGNVYIPDFWLPHSIDDFAEDGWGFWAEMKPVRREENDPQVSKLFQVCQMTKHNGLLFMGYPDKDAYEVVKYSVGNEEDKPRYGQLYGIISGLSFRPESESICQLQNDSGYGSFPFGKRPPNIAYIEAKYVKAGQS